MQFISVIVLFLLVPTSVFAIPRIHSNTFTGFALGRKTAIAVFYQPDGLHGSVVFSQDSQHHPVSVHVAIHNNEKNSDTNATLGLYRTAVKFGENYNPADKVQAGCDVELLGGGILSGDLVVRGKFERNGIAGRHGSWDRTYLSPRLTLFGAGSITGQSVRVVHTGDNVHAKRDDVLCGTIEETLMGTQRIMAGHIPCEKRQYDDCLVSTRFVGVCTKRRCEGYTRFWGPVSPETELCFVTYENYPMQNVGSIRQNSQKFACTLGMHSLLTPIA